MQKLKTRNISVIALAILMIISTGASIMQTSYAHSPPWQLPTFAYVQAVPNPIGVGQTATVYMWLANTYDNSLKTNDYRFHNYQLTITAPDGTVTTQNFANITDPTSNQFYSFVPTQSGTYQLNFTYPGQDINAYSHLSTSAAVNDSYLPSHASTTLTVQQTPIPTIGDLPLPTEYWARPIYGENVNWYSVSSNWLGTGSAGYGTGAAGCNYPPGEAIGPQTSHVMWTYPLDMGGIVGGTIPAAGSTNFEGSAYNGRFTNPIIINGYLYYTKPVTFTGPSSGPTVCQDLRTGKIIWSSNIIPQYLLAMSTISKTLTSTEYIHQFSSPATLHKHMMHIQESTFQRNRRPHRHLTSRSIRRTTKTHLNQQRQCHKSKPVSEPMEFIQTLGKCCESMDTYKS